MVRLFVALKMSAEIVKVARSITRKSFATRRSSWYTSSKRRSPRFSRATVGAPPRRPETAARNRFGYPWRYSRLAPMLMSNGATYRAARLALYFELRNTLPNAPEPADCGAIWPPMHAGAPAYWETPLTMPVLGRPVVGFANESSPQSSV